MPGSRPSVDQLIGKDLQEVPMSCQRVVQDATVGEHVWIGPEDAAALSGEEKEAYELAHQILCHLAIQAPTKHKSGHPGGPLSAFNPSYWVNKLRDPSVDQPMRMSPGHLSVLGFGLEYLFGRGSDDNRIDSPQSIIDTFRTPDGLPGHIEAGIGSIPFGTGPLGKGVSQALGVAYGLKYLQKPGKVDVLLADGDSQEGQVMEAVRLAPQLGLDNLIVHGDFNDIQLSGLPTRVVASDFSSILHASGWQVIEVQNGNDPAQAKAAIEYADSLSGQGRPIFICYYTTMGNGIALMEEGSNTGEKNYHGAPLAADVAEEQVSLLPDLEEITEKYEQYRKAEENRYKANDATLTNFSLSFDPSSDGYERVIMEEKGAARKEFGATHVLEMMKVDPRIVVLHADLAGSGGFNAVEKEFPDRVINVGVAEANMYMMASGMRQAGVLPITYTFAAFGTYEARANARLIDVNCGHTRCAALHDCTHAGLSVGEDGETHQERNYLNIPLDHTQVWMSADSNQSAAMAEKGLALVAEGHTSVYTFFPRSGHEQLKNPDGQIIYGPDYTFDGKADLIRGSGDSSDQVTVLATGIPIHFAVDAADQLASGEDPINVRVLNVACVRPIDASAIIQAALETQHLVVVEDHNSEGGLATQVADIIADFNLPCTLRRLGVNHYFPSAPANDLFLMAGIDTDSIVDAVQDEVRAEICGGEDAFVSAIHELGHNLVHSRFAESAQEFVCKLKDKKGYLDALRADFVARECPKDKLPSNEQLLSKF